MDKEHREKFVEKLKELKSLGWSRVRISQESGISHNVIANAMLGRPYTLTSLMYDKIEELSHASNLSNVAHLKEENERLKDLVLEKSAKIEALYEGTEEYQKLLLEAQRLIAEYQKIIPDSKTDNDETS